MISEAIVEFAHDLKGVYGCFTSTWDGFLLAGHLPPDHPPEVVQGIVDSGVELFADIEGQLPDCNEVQIDLVDYAILMFENDGVLLYLLVNTRNEIDNLKAKIQDFPIDGWNNAIASSKDELSFYGSTRYTDEVTIGEGGTAMVYRAFDSRLRRFVALKRFKDKENAFKSDDYLAELESASRIQSKNVINIYDADVDQHGRFLVMELIKGEDLEKRVTQSPLDPETFANIAGQAFEALAETHAGGLLHLDLKPANIMLTEEFGERSHLTLIDYGRAKLRMDENGQAPKGLGLNGSIYFASPEFLMGTELDERADIYSLGCVFYWALTGQRPFEGEGPVQIMAAHLQQHVEDLAKVNPAIPKWMSTFVMDCLSYEPNARPANAQTALERILKKI